MQDTEPNDLVRQVRSLRTFGRTHRKTAFQFQKYDIFMGVAAFVYKSLGNGTSALQPDAVPNLLPRITSRNQPAVVPVSFRTQQCFLNATKEDSSKGGGGSTNVVRHPKCNSLSGVVFGRLREPLCSFFCIPSPCCHFQHALLSSGFFLVQELSRNWGAVLFTLRSVALGSAPIVFSCGLSLRREYPTLEPLSNAVAILPRSDERGHPPNKSGRACRGNQKCQPTVPRSVRAWRRLRCCFSFLSVACLDVEDGGPANKVLKHQVWAELPGGGPRLQEPSLCFVLVAVNVQVASSDGFGEKVAWVHDVLFFTVLEDGMSA